MAKRSTRRSISIKAPSYQRLKDHCDEVGMSVSGWLEIALTEKLDALGAPPADPERLRQIEHDRARRLAEERRSIEDKHFTF